MCIYRERISSSLKSLVSHLVDETNQEKVEEHLQNSIFTEALGEALAYLGTSSPRQHRAETFVGVAPIEFLFTWCF